MIKKRGLLLDKVKVRHFPWFLAGVLVLFLTTGIFVYWQAGRQVEQAVIDRVKEQTLILARSGSLSISQFFEARKNEVILLSKVEAVAAGREKEGREALQVLVETLKDADVVDVVRTNKEGIVLWEANLFDTRLGEGISVADRDYFLWAKEQKESRDVFVGLPVVARGGMLKGKWAVVMAAPVFYQGEFNGIVSLGIPLEVLAEKYVKPLVLSPRTEALVIARNGVILASTVPGAVGENLLERVQAEKGKRQKEYLALVKEALSGKEGSSVYYFHLLFPAEEQTKVVTAYAPIKLGDQIWSLWVSLPHEEATRYVQPVLAIQNQGLFFGLTGLVVLVLTFVLGVRVAQREGFIDGFRDGRNGVKQTSKSD
jgi:hypothetical protein